MDARVGYGIADYIADNYGECDRGADCYHGKDSRGRPNGCLRLGWLGRKCPHWHPVKATTLNSEAATRSAELNLSALKDNP